MISYGTVPRNAEIFLVGYYGFRNTGDELILCSILNDLRKAVPGASFTVISHDPDQTAADHGVRTIHWSDPQAIVEATERASLVVVGGGGLFHDTLGFAPNLLFTKQNWGLGLYVGAALYGALSEKRVMLWGVGVGPLTSAAARDYTKAACLAADVVTVRDELSKTLLESAGVPSSKVTVTADSAFASEPRTRIGGASRKITTSKRSDEGPTVGVVVRQWDVGVSARHWERELGAALGGFAESEKARLVFLPFQTLDSEKENDLAVAKRIAARLGSRADVAVIEEHLTPGETEDVIAGCDLLIGMRLHSVVIAAQAGVPVVALSYDPKVSALMDRVGMSEFDFPVRKIESGGLVRLMTQAHRRKREIAASLRAAANGLAAEARKNVELACELLNSSHERKGFSQELLPIVACAINGQIAAAHQSDQQMRFKQVQVEELSALVTQQHADNEGLIEQVRQQREKVEELSALVTKQHADNEEVIAQLELRNAKVEELAALVSKQHADNEEVIAQLELRNAKVEELAALVSKQHADNEEVIAQLELKNAKVEELAACITKQHDDNEELIGQVRRQQEKIEELSLDARQHHVDNTELTSTLKLKEAEVAELREQLERLRSSSALSTTRRRKTRRLRSPQGPL